MLEATNIAYRVGAKALLEDVSAHVGPGEMLAVVGANGAGKSTLLKLLCGDLRSASGTICLDGRPLDQWPRMDVAKRRGILPQSSDLGFSFTALEVALMGRFPHLSGPEGVIDYAIAKGALALTGVGELEDRIYPTLSGGEQQRVQLARVAAQIWDAPSEGNRYLLLDEPTSSLDLSHQHRLLASARRFVEDGVGACVVLHDLNFAAQYADRITVLKDGRQLATGAPDEIITPDLVLQAFEFEVNVIEHPTLGCPLMIPLPNRQGTARKEAPAHESVS